MAFHKFVLTHISNVSYWKMKGITKDDSTAKMLIVSDSR